MLETYQFEPTDKVISTSGLTEKKLKTFEFNFFSSKRDISCRDNVVTCFQLGSMDKVHARNDSLGKVHAINYCKRVNTSSECYSILRTMPYSVLETARQAK
jgi:hypothetical protein